MRNLLALAVLLLVPLAGCSTPTPPPPADPCQQPSPPASCAPPPPKPEPVHLSDGAEMTQPGSKDYSWKVSPGVKELVVAVTLNGPSGAPALELVNYHYSLTGGPDGTQYEGNDSSILNGGSGPLCDPCFNGEDAAEDGNLDALAGDWKLHLEWDASAARYDLDVSVTY